MPKVAIKPRKQVPVVARLSVDYPQQDEEISSPQYTFRLCAPEGARRVEVSVDQGDWRPCRPAIGYWWYDWSDYGDGEHEVVARIETLTGKAVISEPHEFFVTLRPKP